MAARRTALDVVYDDGTEDRIIIKPISLIACEREFGGTIPMVEGTVWAAWHSAKKPMGNFDAWASKLDAMQEIDLAAEAKKPEGDTPSPEAPPAE